MFFLVTLGLVVVGALSLVIGALTDATALIYLSITCSVVAFVLLVVFARVAKRQEAVGAEAAAPWAAPPAPEPAPERAAEPEPAAAEPAVAEEPVGAGERTTKLPRVATAGDGAGARGGLPIDGYDDLRVTEILPLLADLDLDQLEAVRDHEEEGRNRSTVIRRVDKLMDEREAEQEAGFPIDGYDELRVNQILPLLAGLDADELTLVRAREEQGRNRSTVHKRIDVLLARRQAEEAPLEADTTVVVPTDTGLPIADYDRRTVGEILARLDDLTDEELDVLAEREEAGRNRAVILNAIDAQFEDVEEDGEPAPPPAPAERPARAAAAGELPISGYDEMRVIQVLPLLPSLDLHQLEAVRRHEEQGRNRPTLMRRLEDRIEEVQREQDAGGEPEPAPVAAPAPEAGGDGFPIPDYDRRTVAEILPLLDELDNEELDRVAEREQEGKNRTTLLRAIDAMFDQEGPEDRPDVEQDPTPTARIPTTAKRR